MENAVEKKHLPHYYKKELRSFLAHVDKVSTDDDKGMHKLRVRIKQMKAVFELLAMLFPRQFRTKDYHALLKPVFDSAGEIRQIHVNLSGVRKYKLPPTVIRQYERFLKKKEEKYKKEFLRAIRHMDAHQLKKSKKKVRKLTEGMGDEKVVNDCRLFVKREAQMIQRLRAAGDNPAIVHKIRKHLKSLSVVAALSYKIRPTDEQKTLETLAKESATQIGDWHDKIVLVASLERFLAKTDTIKSEGMLSLSNVIKTIQKETVVPEVPQGILEG